MAIETDKLETTLAFLISKADPEGLNYKKLTKILDQIKRNVLIGPKTRRYIHELVEKFDNIECESLSDSGMCRKIKGAGRCQYASWYRECSFYTQVKPEKRGNPIKLGGQDG